MLIVCTLNRFVHIEDVACEQFRSRINGSLCHVNGSIHITDCVAWLMFFRRMSNGFVLIDDRISK
jgi:hypothetical protein